MGPDTNGSCHYCPVKTSSPPWVEPTEGGTPSIQRELSPKLLPLETLSETGTWALREMNPHTPAPPRSGSLSWSSQEMVAVLSPNRTAQAIGSPGPGHRLTRKTTLGKHCSRFQERPR